MIAYLILVITFIFLGVLSLIKGIKEGIIASFIGAITTIIVYIVHFFINKVNSFFGRYQITMMDFFKWLLIIAMGIITFILLSFIVRLNVKSSAKLKSKNNRWKK